MIEPSFNPRHQPHLKNCLGPQEEYNIKAKSLKYRIGLKTSHIQIRLSVDVARTC